MKVLLLNGSPHKNGCTFTALSEVASSLNKDGIETEIVHIACGPVNSCITCNCCEKTKKCVLQDGLNEVIEKARECDGFIFGSPVHFASPSGAIVSFLDRFFRIVGQEIAGRPCGCLVSARRAGTTSSLDVLNKYPLINSMPVVASNYWCMVHGNTPDEVKQDVEGLQIMRQLGTDMAWLLKCIEAGKKEGVVYKQNEQKIKTNYIR